MIQAKRLTASGNVTTDNAVLLSVIHDQDANAGAGQVTIKDTDTNGSIQYDVSSPTGSKVFQIGIPSPGIPCPGGIHLDVATNMASVTVLYRKVK